MRCKRGEGLDKKARRSRKETCALPVTPVHEAAQLQEYLLRAGTTPFARSEFLSFRNLRFLCLPSVALFSDEVQQKLATRVVLIPWRVKPPVGAELSQDRFEPLMTK